MKTLTHGGLFAGIDGFGLGADAAGIETVWAVEIDPECRKLIAAKRPGLIIHDDVRTAGAHNLPPVDVITFGSPCQDLSVAGKRGGLAGARSGLFHEAIRIITELRPTWAVWENVPGAFSSNEGRDFGAVLDALADAGALDVAWRVLDARWFGVPQRRRRVFVVADFGGERAAQVLFESEGVPGHPAPGREAGEGVASPVTASAGHHGHSSPRGDGGDNLVVETSDPQPLMLRNGGRDCDERPGRTGVSLSEDAFALQSQQQHALLKGQRDKERGREGGRNLEMQEDVAYALTAPNGGGRRHEMNVAVPATTPPAPIPLLEVGKRAGEAANDPRAGLGVGEAGDPMYTLQAGAQHGVLVPAPAGAPCLGFDSTFGENSNVFTDQVPPLKTSPCAALAFGHNDTRGPVDYSHNLTAHPTGRLDFESETFIVAARNSGQGYWTEDDAAQLRAQGGGTPQNIVGTLQASGAGLSRPAGMASEASFVVPVTLDAELNTHYDAAGTLMRDSPTGGGQRPVVAYGISSQPTPKYGEDISPTLDAKEKGGGRSEAVAFGMTARRLTPLESERLQGFPDGYTEGFADSTRYRMLGNAVAVPVVAWILKRLARAADSPSFLAPA